MILERVWRELRGQSRWSYWGMLASAGCTFAALLMGSPNHGFGGPVLYFAVLCGSGALLVLSIISLVLRNGSDAGDR